MKKLEELNSSYALSMPADLLGEVERQYFPTLFMKDGAVLVSTVSCFEDYRKAYAYADFKGQGKSTVREFGISYRNALGALIHLDSTTMDGLLECYWDRQSEKQVMRFFEEGNFA